MANYYFSAKLYDKNTKRLCYDEKESGLSYFKSFADEANNLNKITLFIPFRNILLPKGKHDVKIEINASDNSGVFKFNNLSSKLITIEQAQVYIAKLTVSDIKVAYGKYDASSALGRMFSKQGSSKGYGYPDVYWNLKIGDYSIYKSGVHKNSFSAPSGSFSFKMLDGDKISVSTYDRDALNYDDFIGKITVKTKNGKFKIKDKITSQGKMTNIKYSFIKNKLASDFGA